MSMGDRLDDDCDSATKDNVDNNDDSAMGKDLDDDGNSAMGDNNNGEYAKVKNNN